MKYLVTVLALGLSTAVAAQSIVSNNGSTTITSRDGSSVTSSTITSRDGSTVSANTSSGNAGSVILDNRSSVTSSTTTDGTGASTSSMVSRSGSMCSATYAGQRCDVSCQPPQIAQCGKAESTAEPACYCR
jgi:hypothetical protein